MTHPTPRAAPHLRRPRDDHVAARCRPARGGARPASAPARLC